MVWVHVRTQRVVYRPDAIVRTYRTYRAEVLEFPRLKRFGPHPGEPERL